MKSLSTQPLSIRTDDAIRRPGLTTTLGRSGLNRALKGSVLPESIMGSNFAGLCENVNNFGKDGIFASDTSPCQLFGNFNSSSEEVVF